MEAESTIERELQDLEGLGPQENQEGTFMQQTITNSSNDDIPPGSLDPAQPTELVGSESNLATSLSPKPGLLFPNQILKILLSPGCALL